jgi:hypothetical protein
MTEAKMKHSLNLKNFFLSSLLLSSFSVFGFQERIDYVSEFSSLESLASATDLLEGKINTSSSSYLEIEKAYAKQVTSELTKSQSLETSPDDDADTHSNPDHLNLTQFWAIYGYTTGDFMPINKALRSKNPKAQLEKENQLLNQVIVIRAALQKMKSFKGTVYRGTHLSSASLAKHRPGEIINYPGFLSTSKNREASENFVQNALLIIHGKNGKSVRNYSQVPQEDEILFDHNSKFKVIKRKKTRIEFIENPVVEEIELEEI